MIQFVQIQVNYHTPINRHHGLKIQQQEQRVNQLVWDVHKITSVAKHIKLGVIIGNIK